MTKWSTRAPNDIFLVSESTDLRRQLSSSSYEMPIYIPSRNITRGEIFELISTLEPDLVIVDLSSQDEYGSSLIRRLTARQSSPFILAVGPDTGDRAIQARRALIAGATGYLTPAEFCDQLERAVQRMTGGEIFLSEETKKTLADPLYA